MHGFEAHFGRKSDLTANADLFTNATGGGIWFSGDAGRPLDGRRIPPQASRPGRLMVTADFACFDRCGQALTVDLRKAGDPQVIEESLVAARDDAEVLAVAALRHDDLPVAELDGPTRQVKPLVDYRRDLVRQRTRAVTGCVGSYTSSTRPCTCPPEGCATTTSWTTWPTGCGRTAAWLPASSANSSTASVTSPGAPTS